MSGTSLDGIDAALVAFSERKFELAATIFRPFIPAFREKLCASCCNKTVDVESLGRLDAELGILFADVTVKLLQTSNIAARDVRAIGCHGQTLYHSPSTSPSFTLQIGDPNRIAEITGIPTVADFRRRDMAAGGEGAPMVPAFHEAVFRSSAENRVVVNIGGIANITVLPKSLDREIIGFDVGPGNALIDFWALTHIDRPFDDSGSWAKTGTLNRLLLKVLKEDPYFEIPPPKSTGKEYFSGEWLESKLKTIGSTIAPQDIQNTLCQFASDIIIESIARYSGSTERLLVCGGGAHNKTLMENLRESASFPVDSTERFGIDPNWVEATAFAWLARQRIQELPGNLPEVTGAKKRLILGALYPGR